MERGIVLVGLNHRTAPVEVRERVAFANGRLEPSLRRLMGVEGVAEGAILSTCNRVEVVACGPDPAAVGAVLPGFLAREHGVPEPALAGHLYTHTDREAVRWERLTRYLPLADLAIAAASGEEFLLPRAAVEEAMHVRRHRPMFLIDLAVPRALDPAVNQLDNVYLYDIDDLEGVVAQNRGARAREAVKAETIVDAEVEAFWRWFTSLDVVPTIVALRERVEAIRRCEVERSLAALGPVDPRQRETIERLTQAIVNKVLHAPLTALRRHRADPAEAFYVEAVRRLFRLGTGEAGAE